MPKANLADQVRRRAADRLSDLGFRGRRNRPLTLDLDADWHGWLGLNTGYYADTDQVSLLPIVGIRHAGVERLVARLCGSEFDPSGAPTVSTPLVGVVPSGAPHRWVLSRDHAGEEEALKELRHAVADYAVPFIKAGATSLQALGSLAEAGTGHEHMLAYRIPVIRLLSGDSIGAVQAVDQELSKLGSRQDPAAELFRQFAVRLTEASKNQAPHASS